ncbi:hypothetical protein FRC17_008350, partial [Serendipita sp. 399]
ILTPNAVADYEDVVWRFLKESDELKEDEVDDVIEMEVEENLEDALGRVVNGVVELIGVDPPSDEQMGEALRVARGYQPDTKKQLNQAEKKETQKGVEEKKKVAEPNGASKKAKVVAPRYYGLLPEIDIREVMGGILNSNVVVPDDARELWEHLKQHSRLPQVPHITIVHSKTRVDEEDVWVACEKLTQGPQPLFQFKIGHLVWNDRVMALTVEDLSIMANGGDGDGEKPGHVFLQSLRPKIQDRLHITIGTREASIPPVEAKALVENWRAGKGVKSVSIKDVTARGRIKGLVA